MRTMALTRLRDMAMTETADSEVTQPDDVLIRMGSVGVCGSDVHYYTTGRIGDQVVEFPFPVGHEGAGTVIAVGSEVTKVKVGDRVAFDPTMPCHNCDQCHADRHHTCRNIKFLGCPGQAEGCLKDLQTMPEWSCFPIPDEMTLDQAALSEPLSIGVYACRGAGDLRGKKVGILGMGPIGLSVMLPAQAYGASDFYVTDPLEYRLDLARRAGAEWAEDPKSVDVREKLASDQPELLDVVFECCGQQSALEDAISMLKPGGKLMIIGIPETDEVVFQPHTMRRKEITIVNVRRQNGCVQEALDLISDKRVDVDLMVTHHVDFADTKKAFDMVAGYEDGVVKAMVGF